MYSAHSCMYINYTLLVTGGIYGTCNVSSCIIHKRFWFYSGGALRGKGISEIDLTFWFYHVLCIHVAAPLVKKHSTIIIIILPAMQAEGLLFSSFQVPQQEYFFPFFYYM